MAIFVESQWVWIALAIITFVVGYSFFVNSRQNKTLLLTVLATAVVLCGGLALEHFVVTDREVILDTFEQISTAIKSDNVEKVKAFIAPDADQLRGVAVSGMSQAKLTVVNSSNINVTFNDATSPKTASVSFTVTFRGKLKGNSLLGESEFANQYKFIAVFEQAGKRKWLVTDDITFDNNFPLNFSNTSPVK